jgi:hypothetical protein
MPGLNHRHDPRRNIRCYSSNPAPRSAGNGEGTVGEKQRSLFGQHPTASEAQPDPVRRGLVPVARPGQPLTKAQRDFKRLIAKVEGQRAKLERETQRLDKALAYYGEHLHPRVLRRTALRKDLIRALAAFFTDKRLKKVEQKALNAMVSEQLSEVMNLDQGLNEADLGAIFERVYGRAFADVQREELEALRSAMKGMAEGLGVDIDLSGIRLNPNDPDLAASKAEFAARMRQMAEESERKHEERRARRRKTPRQLEREEKMRQVEEARAKSIASIYKQLARVLHPDLEQDPGLRQRKSLLMQELTAAYRSNDLHTLLRLELEWVHREEGDIERLTDGKLEIYNQILKEQADDLEREIYRLRGHPRYRPIAEERPFFESRVRTDGPAQARRLDSDIVDMEEGLHQLRSADGLQVLRHMIAAWRAQAPF